MKSFFTFILITLMASGFAFAQEADASEFVLASAEVDSFLATFVFENVSECQLDSVNARVAHNKVYLSTDDISLFVDLAPGESGRFAQRLSRVVNPDWQWALDSVTLSDCDAAGEVVFERFSFGEPQAVAAVAPTSEALTYTIAKGDTVFIIADKFGITARELMSANGMTSEALIFGRTLTIPSSATGSSFRMHTVVEGDTLFSLSQRYETDVAVIEKANCLESGVLKLGQELRIPPQGVTDAAASCP